MTTTPNLGLTHLQPNSSQPEVPANVERLFAIKNDSGQTATVQVSGGAGANVAIATGTARILHSDGTDVIAIA